MNIEEAMKAMSEHAQSAHDKLMAEANKGLEDPQAILVKHLNNDPCNTMNQAYLKVGTAVSMGQLGRQKVFLEFIPMWLHWFFLMGYKAGRRDANVNGIKWAVAPEQPADDVPL